MTVVVTLVTVCVILATGRAEMVALVRVPAVVPRILLSGKGAKEELTVIANVASSVVPKQAGWCVFLENVRLDVRPRKEPFRPATVLVHKGLDGNSFFFIAVGADKVVVPATIPPPKLDTCSVAFTALAIVE